jgi:uncharacterized protein YfaS (alpha-2-macroglobulin family)
MLLFLCTAQAQNSLKPNRMLLDDFYTQAWKRVDSLLSKGLPKSAVETVQEIYARAQRDDNAAQQVKALIHRLKYINYVEESSLVKCIYETRLEADKAKYPVKPLLHSLMAEIYWQYYAVNRWRFMSRTTTAAEVKLEDLETWDLQKIVDETMHQHHLALQNPAQLKTFPIDVYNDILDQGGKKERGFRPTLYDFIAHRAIDFWMSTEPELTKPAYQFTLNSLDYLKPASEFAKLKIETKDTTSFKYQAVLALQDLITSHLGNPNAEVWADLDLKRLTLIYPLLNAPDKETAYSEALKNLEQRTSQFPISTLVSAGIAQVYYDRGMKYNALASDQYKNELQNAYNLAQQIIQRFPNSEGASDARALQSRITEKNLEITIEEVVPSNEPFTTLISYRNLPKLHWKIVKATREELEALQERFRRSDYPEGEMLKALANRQAVAQWTTTLPDDKDYQRHFTEERLPALPLGEYVALSADNPQFAWRKNAVAYSAFTVSNISFVQRTQPKSNLAEYYTLHRRTGEPLVGVNVEVWYSEYNYNKRKYERIKVGTFASDQKGYVKVPYPQDVNYRTYQAKLTFQADKLDSGQGFYAYQYSEPTRTPKTFFFADRAIYRPGQTLHFKGIVIDGNGEQNELVTNYETVTYLYDVNYQKVAELKLKTNEYGTFSGSFVLPSTGLMGQMHLENHASSSLSEQKHTVLAGETLYRVARQYNITVAELQRMNNLKDENIKIGQILTIIQPNRNYSGTLGSFYFSVEEYKRPKFEVTFEPTKGTFRLNEEITAKGKAKAYSGANIDGADVKYRVVRQARFPWWWYYWRGSYPVSPEMEITNGVAKTNENGEIEVKFKAIPDPNVSKESSPTFIYTVYADVTDLNGETRSGSTGIAVAYQALQVGITNMPERVDLTDKPELEINTTNLAGEFIPAKGTITIHRLQTPKQYFTPRKWGRPDKFLYSEADWRKSFPTRVYQDENNRYAWAKESEALKTEFDTEKNKKLTLSNLNTWAPGEYVLEINAKDKYGEPVKEQAYFTVHNPAVGKLPAPALMDFSVVKSTVEPNEKATLLVGSSEKIRALYEVEHRGEIIAQEWVTLNNEVRKFEIPVKEEYRGNFSVLVSFIKDNQAHLHSAVINVPRSNKELDISFETYRNKLQPGQQEEWKLRIKGKNADKVAAEMVATLYDASLDAFRPNYWSFNIYNTYYTTLSWQNGGTFDAGNFRLYSIDWNEYRSGSYRDYDRLNWFGVNFYYYDRQVERNMGAISDNIYLSETVVTKSVASPNKKAKNGKDRDEAKEEAEESPSAKMDSAITEAKPVATTGGKPEESQRKEDLSGVKARTNFSETAFFFPHLMTDANGDVLVKFTIPEALTRWKMLGFAHTKDLKSGIATNTLVTQKDLMVVPNAPRFFRENDKMAFPSKITNISDKDLEGVAQLFLINPLTGKSLDAELGNTNAQQSFSIKAGQSTALNWKMNITAGTQAITYRVVAKAGNFTDGEEMTLPVLTNSMLVTETMPLPIRSKQTKTFKMDKLLASNKSNTLRHEKLTLEFTSNPAWYAVQALPYMMEFPYECAEQVFSRFYANSMASHIANSSPKVKQVFESWKNLTPDALLSALDKNQELKNVILEETPWLLNANSESSRKRQIGVLFDIQRMAKELETALDKLIKKQVSSGAWTWFEGMPADRYITQHIVTGMGHLDKLKVKVVREDRRAWEMTRKAILFLDREIHEDYEDLKCEERRGKLKLSDQHIWYFQVQYLYARSYFLDIPIDKSYQEAVDYYKGQAQKYWLNFNRYSQGMIALGLNRMADKKTPADIVKSLKERALMNEEMGMYWKDSYGFYWYEAPIETHSLMVEVFDEVANDTKAVDDLKTWLLKQKQTQDWKTTKATAEACYALLLRGENWLTSDNLVDIKLGDMKVNPFAESGGTGAVEAGTGYFKTSWNKEEVKADMGKVTVSKKDEGVAWGALYWQYFEQLDKITPAETPLKLKKELFIEKDSDKGKILVPITEKSPLKVGDLVKVRIELRCDRAMEYVHMKDMRASGFEPTNVLSRYKWQDGLGYYESTRDAATHFFFGYLPKGTFVFEYPLRVTHEGDFSNGVTTIQCMYAPEFASHSEGIRVKVEKK